jgi:hypothetical protein
LTWRNAGERIRGTRWFKVLETRDEIEKNGWRSPGVSRHRSTFWMTRDVDQEQHLEAAATGTSLASLRCARNAYRSRKRKSLMSKHTLGAIIVATALSS